MSLKYRIRLQNDRVIGPFTSEEIGELFLKGHIRGSEACQQFPIGDWRSIQSFPTLKELITIIDKKNLKDPTFVKSDETKVSGSKKAKSGEAKLSSANVTRSEIKTFNEFKFGKNSVDVNYDELEQKYISENPDAKPRTHIEKTVVMRRSPLKPPTEVDKTVVVKLPALARKEVDVPKNIVKVKEIEPKQTHEELANEKTEMFNLRYSLPSINAQLSVSEVEFDKQARIEESQEKKKIRDIQEEIFREAAARETDDDDGDDDDDEEDVEVAEKNNSQKVVVKKKKKGMSIIVALAFMGIFYVLMTPDEVPKSTGPLYVDIKFPVPDPQPNLELANMSLVEARQLYAQGSYVKRALASGLYLKSLQAKFSGNEAMGEIILTYAELLNNTKDMASAANTLYKYIQLSDTKLLSEINTVTGTSQFYGTIGKHQTGIYTVKNFLRAGGKPTPKLLSYYLELLINADELVEARKVFEALKKIPKKPYEAYKQLSSFLLINDKPAEAKAILEEGLKYYPKSVLLLLAYADVLLKEQAVKEYETVLKKINAIEAEGSPEYLSQFLKHMGYLKALQEKNEEASVYFKKSLALKESEDLRMTLSRLEVSGDKTAQTLILESKVIKLLEKAKSEYKNQNIDGAFSFIIEAVDAIPNYIPALVFQVQLNTERGLIDSAIIALERAIAENPQNNQLRRMLVEVYLKAYKTDEVEKTLSLIAQTKFSKSADYASLMGQFAELKRNTNMALKWYNESLKRNPLNDADMFRIAKLLVKSRKYPEARERLSKAILLDPKNVSYLSLFAEILYEQDGTDTAIGYLRDIISEMGEDPVLVSAIAMTYYKSGQIKEFQAYYKKVQELPKKDERFYEFLISAAKLEDRKDEFVKYSKELLKLNPGNLKVRMNLGEFYLDQKQYNDSIDEFTEVKDRLKSYPKVHFQLAKVYLAKMEIGKAREMGLKELELNPNLDAAHFIVGEVHRLSKEYREAILKYERAISLNPRSADALMAMGWIRLNQNYANEAIELFNRALKEEPTNPYIHKQMGDAYKAAGQRALAKEKYEDYLKLSPVAQDKDMIESQIKNLQ